MKDILFGDLCEEWLAFKYCSIKASTYARYSRVIKNYVNPLLGETECGQLKESDVIQFINNLNKRDLKPKTIQDISVIVKSIIKYGNMKKDMKLTLGLIPCPKVDATKIRILNSKEIKKIESQIQENDSLKNIGVLLSLFSGMRLGEICALRWEDIDLIDHKLEVTKTMQRIYVGNKTKVIITTPKTNTSNREIPISDLLYDILLKIPDKKGYVLTSKEKYMEPRGLQRYFKKMMLSIDVDDVNFHALRHTFATYCIQCGVDVKSLSEILGHASVNITLNRYVHSSFQVKVTQLKKLDFK